MKHPIFDRILIFLCVAAIVALAAGMVLMTLGVLDTTVITQTLSLVQNATLWQKVAICAVALALLIFALILLNVILPGKKKRSQPFAVVSNEGGSVNISVKAIENLVEKCLQTHPELTVVSTAIFSEDDSVRITLHITLYEDISIPLAVSALQKEIKQYVQSCAGVDIDSVRVFVDGTVSAQSPIVSPYRVAGVLTQNLREEPVLSTASPYVAPVAPFAGEDASAQDDAASATEESFADADVLKVPEEDAQREETEETAHEPQPEMVVDEPQTLEGEDASEASTDTEAEADSDSEASDEEQHDDETPLW